MLNRFARALLLSLLAGVYVRADPPATQPAVTIALVGDSTVTDKEGWGLGFRRQMADRAQVRNFAAGGRSSKSFIAEGRWEKAMETKPAYVLIQFGHNDQPGKGPALETDPATTYTENLTRFIDESRAIGAKPILVTPLVRRYFDPANKIRNSSLAPYADAMRALAKAKNVPLIDLNTRSKALFEGLGPDRSNELGPAGPNGPDRTHLNDRGGDEVAKLVIDELKRVMPEWADPAE